MLVVKLDDLNLISEICTVDGRGKQGPTNCPLTSTGMLWTDRWMENLKQQQQQKFLPGLEEEILFVDMKAGFYFSPSLNNSSDR